MARNNDRDRGPRRAPKETGRRTKKKICIFCKDHATWVDYKDVNLLRKFMSQSGQDPSATGVRQLCPAPARGSPCHQDGWELALLPFTQRTTSERPSGRGAGRGAGPGRGPARSDSAEEPEALLADVVLDDEIEDSDLDDSELESLVLTGADDEAGEQ